MEQDRAYRRIYRSTSAKPPSKMSLASGFVGNVIRGNTVRNETPSIARQFHFCEEGLFGECETWGLCLLMGNSGKIRLLESAKLEISIISMV